jgi:hypothetical protein
MENDENPKRLQAREVMFSLNPHAIVIDKNQERVERGEKRREVIYFFQFTRHGKRRGIERSNTQENTSAQTIYRVPRPRCTKCAKTSLGFLAVRLSPQEPKKYYGLNRYKHTRA